MPQFTFEYVFLIKPHLIYVLYFYIILFLFHFTVQIRDIWYKVLFFSYFITFHDDNQRGQIFYYYYYNHYWICHFLLLHDMSSNIIYMFLIWTWLNFFFVCVYASLFFPIWTLKHIKNIQWKIRRRKI